MNKEFFFRNFGEKGEHLQDASSWLSVTAANGLPIKQVGFAEMCIDILEHRLADVGVIVVDDSSSSVPVILGTNVIDRCKLSIFPGKKSNYVHKLPGGKEGEAWQKALTSHQRRQALADDNGRVGFVRAPGRTDIVVPAQHEIVIFCKTRPSNSPYSVIVESPEEGVLPNGILVAKSFAEVKHGRFPVRLANVTLRDITIGRHAILGEVFLASEVRESENSVRLSHDDSHTVHVDLINASNDSSDTPAGDTGDLKDMIPGLDIDESQLTPSQRDQLAALLRKHKHAFANDDSDLGFTTTVVHDIPTGDAPPCQERYRRIPPALYQEPQQLINTSPTLTMMKLPKSGVRKGQRKAFSLSDLGTRRRTHPRTCSLIISGHSAEAGRSARGEHAGSSHPTADRRRGNLRR
ncbi:Hypp699 [Branchiostoma lanceolatum]|uniref:Hypp699 protein n=1 Tax=Branchiostoma lanceolatum TaxID=7740 RepID=A0A8J9YPH6_BRALA|nr:Hypp699 [Branchiostoma lanceolatum]